MNPKARDPAEIFDEASGLPDGPERASFLERACDGDSSLRRRVEALLSASNRAEDFFAETTAAITETIVALRCARGAEAFAETLEACMPGEESIGSVIGRYKLVRKIGEGGCGAVYEAEQQEPVTRRVALKIIRLGMETKSVIARFEAERQALAMMDHPNIAYVFDAGATQRGSPYFVMELVRGVKITEYCNRNRLDTSARLDLFIQICHAIQHAHQKGVIHGDIKPSNIMVTLRDGLPLPKVIDFGISRATEVNLADKMLVTADGQLIGTPAYMSPEQADMGGMDVDTRSDIYSLGVLLYELLTGGPPLDPKLLGAAGFDGMRRMLREQEPPRPSERLRQLSPSEQIEVAAARQSEPGRLSALYHGDLDWIVMKALEKDRRRRYETANGLAMDLQRHLGNEPVMARPPTRLYRFRKLVRRNRGVFIATGAVAVTLIFGMATSTWLFLREREARHRAVAAEQQQARLRKDAEQRQKIAQAALLVSQERYREADSLVTGIGFTEPTVEGAAVFRALGEWHAIEGRWPRAAERFAMMTRMDQHDGWDVTSLDVLREGPAVLFGAGLRAYDRFREGVIERHASMPGETGDRVVKIALLVPGDEKLMAALTVFAAGTEKSRQKALASGDGFTAAWRAMSLALWEYRRGDYAKAIEWSKECLAPPESNPPRLATAHVITAMAERKLGNVEAAERHLFEAREIFATKHNGLPSRGTPVQGFWFDWEFARALMNEASAR